MIDFQNSVDVIMRPMVVMDIPNVMDIENRVYPFPWTEGIFRDCLYSGYFCWVIESRDQLLGYAIMSVGAGDAHVLNICISPAMQGQGIGRKLLDYLIDKAKEHGAINMYLEVRPSNNVAIGLYDSVGFNEVGIRKAYYPANNGREDALVYAKYIGHNPFGH